MLNESKGNMYDWVTHTWNPIKGKCEHDCWYCFMKKLRRTPATEVRLDEKELTTNLGSGNFIFVGSSCDDWSKAIPDEWIKRMLDYCNMYTGNRYLFQSKNPQRFLEYVDHPLFKSGKVVLCTTIETNRRYPEMGNTPDPLERAEAMAKLAEMEFDCYVTAEPIMDFDHDAMLELILKCHPKQVNIGKNTNYKVRLPEPDAYKVVKLARALKANGIKVKLKKNIMGYLKFVLDDQDLSEAN